MTNYLPAIMFDRRGHAACESQRRHVPLREKGESVLRVSNAYIIVYSMHATIYGRGQMVIPAQARKEARIDSGDVVNVLPEGDGRLVLVRMERPKPKPRNKVRIIRRKGKHSLLSIRRKISRDEIFKALEQFPP
jgi:AbrB family looped-hinge helix DNA binding protein